MGLEQPQGGGGGSRNSPEGGVVGPEQPQRSSKPTASPPFGVVVDSPLPTLWGRSRPTAPRSTKVGECWVQNSTKGGGGR